MSSNKIFIILMAFVIFTSCQEMPHKLDYENTLDNKNPITHGDPFQLKASVVNKQVILTWNAVDHDKLQGYNIYRSLEVPQNFSKMDSTLKRDTTWTDTSIEDGHSYWYKVTAYDKNEQESSQSNVVPARVDTDPVLFINDNIPVTFSVVVNLTILAPNAIEMWISNYPHFSDGHWELYSSSKIWNLPVNDGELAVYVKVKYEDGSISKTFSDVIRLDLSSPPMVYIPEGEFIMGSPDTTGDIDETPQHTVYVNGFWIDQFEITNEQYAKFLSDGNGGHYHAEMKIVNHGSGIFYAKEGYESHPVVYVNYESAKAYANWRGASLPTEAQWEKAARGTDQRIYPWGDLLETNRVNYWNSDDPFENSAPPKTTPVGFYNGNNVHGYQTKDSPGPYETYDMAGNVWEWCLDWYDANYYSQSPYENPSGAASGTYRVIRGGSWADDPYYLRSACRSHRQPFDACGFVGFRCVK